jgi:3-hydroxybutyryl-CoA dehydrogenase
VPAANSKCDNMIIAVLADEVQKAELSTHPFREGVECVFADSLRSLLIIEADAYFDLEFEPDPERIRKLASLLPKPVVINSVIFTTKETNKSFIRLNAWPTMLKRPTAELAVSNNQDAAAKLFDSIGWAYHFVPDIPGMITPRIVCMIVNEAFFAMAEKVSTMDEIDKAMKLGTNYPLGPFEWAELIGVGRVRELLIELNRANTRYSIAPQLSEGTI